MPEKTTNLNLPIPLGNENVNRQYFVDLIQAIDSGAVSEEQLAEQVKRLTEGKQDLLRLADNYLAASVLVNAAPDAQGRAYPDGVSMFKVSNAAAGWPAANGYVMTFRAGSGGYQIFYELYMGAVQTDKTARQWTRSKRDSNAFWQDWARGLTESDLKLADNYKAPTAAVTEYPEGRSVFYVGGGTGGQGSAWATAAGATETFGWVETVRTGSAGYQTFTEMYSGTSTMDTLGNRQFKRVKRDSNSFWQPFEKIIDAGDFKALTTDHSRIPLYVPITTGIGTLYTAAATGEGINMIPDGFALTFVPNVTNTGAASVKIDSAAVVALKNIGGVDFAAGDLIAGQPYQFRKVNGNFIKSSGGGLYSGLEVPYEKIVAPVPPPRLTIDKNYGGTGTAQDVGRGGVHIDEVRDRVFILLNTGWIIYSLSTGGQIASGTTTYSPLYSAYDHVTGLVFYDSNGSNGLPNRLDMTTGALNVGWTVNASTSITAQAVEPDYAGGYFALSTTSNGTIRRYDSSNALITSYTTGYVAERVLAYDPATTRLYYIESANGTTSDFRYLRYITVTTAVITNVRTIAPNGTTVFYLFRTLVFSPSDGYLYTAAEANNGSWANPTLFSLAPAAAGGEPTMRSYLRYPDVDDAGNVYAFCISPFLIQKLTPKTLSPSNANAQVELTPNAYSGMRHGPEVSKNSKYKSSPPFAVQVGDASASGTPKVLRVYTQSLKVL